jgi:hypothetical protein
MCLPEIKRTAINEWIAINWRIDVIANWATIEVHRPWRLVQPGESRRIAAIAGSLRQ